MSNQFEGRVKIGNPGGEDELTRKAKKAWDPDQFGYGKHEYFQVDPETINPADFARNLRGDERHFGDVREYNAADNNKHPENDVNLDWLGRPGTVILTEAVGYEGHWIVTGMPVVKAPYIAARLTRCDQDGEVLSGEDQQEIPTLMLGCTAGEDNLFRQVKTTIVKKQVLGKKHREKLTKR